MEKRLKEDGGSGKHRHPAGLLPLCGDDLARAVLPEAGARGPARLRDRGKGFGVIWWLIGLGLALLFLGSRLRPAWHRGLLAAVAGFLGIVSESVLILAYQAKEGVLYQEIGLLLVAFMAGLALGAGS